MSILSFVVLTCDSHVGGDVTAPGRDRQCNRHSDQAKSHHRHRCWLCRRWLKIEKGAIKTRQKIVYIMSVVCVR